MISNATLHHHADTPSYLFHLFCIFTQARSELLTGLSSVLATQGSEGAFDLADMQLLLKWLDALARHPTGADDVTPVPGVLPPVQKLVLQILAHFNTVRATADIPVCSRLY
jgi:hypothetical protein